MGFLDKAKGALGKAETMAGAHSDQIKAGLDKAEALANKATKGKYKSAIVGAGDKAADFVDGLKPKDEATPSEEPTEPTPPPAQ